MRFVQGMGEVGEQGVGGVEVGVMNNRVDCTDENDSGRRCESYIASVVHVEEGEGMWMNVEKMCAWRARGDVQSTSRCTFSAFFGNHSEHALRNLIMLLGTSSLWSITE